MLIGLFVALIVTLVLTQKPAGPAVGFEDNYFVQQSVRIRNENQNK